MLICNICCQLYFFIHFVDINHVLLGISNQIKSNVTNSYYSFQVQTQGKKIIGSYWLSKIKWPAYLFYNKVYKCGGVNAIARIIAMTNIAIVTK